MKYVAVAAFVVLHEGKTIANMQLLKFTALGCCVLVNGSQVYALCRTSGMLRHGAEQVAD